MLLLLFLLFAGAAGGADNWAGVAGAGAGLAGGLAAGISATGAGAGEEGEGEGIIAAGGELEYVAACCCGGGDGMLLAGGAMGIEVVVGGELAAAGAVPFCWMASWVNCSWDLSAVGLMLKVMPLPQWEVGVFCLQ